MTKRIDLTKQQFGDLEVIRLSDRRNGRNVLLWECLCACNETIYIEGFALRAGHYRSCGCKQPMKRNRGVLKHIVADRVDGTRKTALIAKLHKNNKSGHKGIIWSEDRNKWMAYIGIKGKSITLGYFEDKEMAIEARLKAEEKYHKPYLEESNDGE